MTNKEITNAYYGTDQVEKIYLGSDVIWPAGSPSHDYSKDYLTIEALSAGTFYVRNENCFYSKNGEAWHDAYPNTAITMTQGDKVRFKANNNYYLQGWFSGNTMAFKVYGNIESMEYGDNFSGQTSIKVTSAFTSFFYTCSGLTDASNLVLPATALTDFCYTSMFRGCISLTAAPALPATSFGNKRSCYSGMFRGCTSLTTAPELPATTLASGCYDRMFLGCTSLNYVKCLSADISAQSCLTNWVNNVSPTGTFVKKAGVSWPTGASGIPDGWTVIEE